MFFNGDSSNRKRVDLGGRSTKERDKKNLLEQTRLERNRRLWLRQQNSAALRIQKCFRAKKVVRTEHSKLRQKFLKIYGTNCLNVDRKAFGPDSDFLRQFLYFFNVENHDDFLVLVQICRLILKFVQESGDAARLFAGEDYSFICAFVNCRVKKLAYNCIRAVHHNRNQLKDQLLLTLKESNASAIPLLEVLLLLIDLKLPWSCKIVGYLSQNNGFGLLREIILTGKDNAEKCIGSSLERVLTGVMCHIGQNPCICSDIDPRYSFSSQILTIPFLWNVFPNLRQVFARKGMGQHYIHQMVALVPNLINFLPKDISDEFPTYACLLGNILETGGVALSQPDCSFDMAITLAAVTTFLLEAHSSLTRSDSRENSMIAEDGMTDDEVMEVALDRKLDQQICNSIDTRFLLQLTNILVRNISSANGPEDMEVAAVGAVCGFLYVIFNTLPLERIMTVLAYGTDLVPMLWNFMKRCHENKKWSTLSERLSYPSEDAPGWLLPLAVFCPVYKHMLMIVDNEEFYEQEKPLSLKDISSLVILLKQVLWQLLWVNHTSSANSVRSNAVRTSSKKLSIEGIQQRVSIVVSELLSQLQDWNNRRQFTSPSDFHADGVNDFFISQAVIENARANEILKQAAFLIPFTSRVKIFASQLAAARQRQGSQVVLSRTQFRKRRDDILEDVYNQMSQLSVDDLRGPSQLAAARQRQGSQAVLSRTPFRIRRDHILEDASNQMSQLSLDDLRGPSQLAAARQRQGSQAVLSRTPFRIRPDHILEGGSNQMSLLSLDDLRGLSQLAAARQRQGSQAVLSITQFRIRRDHILEDAYNQMSQLSKDDLRGPIRVTFVNEFGVEEAGIDGGGIFKDFMENITRVSFDVQYGLFKETADHLLYPNPGSGMIHEQHLQFFHFLGTLLAKAMIERIPVDLPFATFFLSKLKQKHNYLNDLPSLDPELYRHLMFLKHYEGDISELELYFVLLNNEDGKQTEEDLLPGGKNLRVTNENVITFIHLAANHRLNSQIRQQSSHFLRGFHTLIEKDWIDMFNEHELQFLISGSLDSLDVDNLRQHTNYAGSYHRAEITKRKTNDSMTTRTIHEGKRFRPRRF